MFQSRFMIFPELIWAQSATIRLLIRAPKVVRHDVKHTGMILKRAKFMLTLTNMAEWFKHKRYCNLVAKTTFSTTPS